MKELFIIAGANGSGKTTFAINFTRLNNLIFVNADIIAKEINPSNRTGGELTAGRIFFKQVDKNMKLGQSFAIESTLSGLYFKKLLKLAKKEGYILKLIYIFLDNPDVCIERIKERVLKGGHYIPENDVIRRYFRSKNNFWNIYKQLVDEWFLIYNSDLQFKEFAIGQKDEYIVNDEELFQAFKKDIDIEVSHES